MNTPMLRFSAVTKHFSTPTGRVDALRRVDITVQKGEFLAVTGPSGAGKSTFLSLAALLDTPSSGKLHIAGCEVSCLAEAELNGLRMHSIGMVFQDYHLLPHRSVLDNVLFRFRYLDIPQRQARDRALAALDAVGLTALVRRPARLLSGGEAQRVAIARAIAQPPQLLVADEPTGNLDTATAQTIMQCFAALNANGLTVLLVTHNTMLLTYCSRHLNCINGHLDEAAA